MWLSFTVNSKGYGISKDVRLHAHIHIHHTPVRIIFQFILRLEIVYYRLKSGNLRESKQAGLLHSRNGPQGYLGQPLERSVKDYLD